MRFWCNTNIVLLSQTVRSETSKTTTSLFSAGFWCCLAETLHKLCRLYLETVGYSRSMQAFGNALFSTSSRSCTSQKTFSCFLGILTLSMLTGLLTFLMTPACRVLFFCSHKFASVSTKQKVFTIRLFRTLMYSYFPLTSSLIKLFWHLGTILHWQSITPSFRTSVKKSRLRHLNK